jgi:hypothetical protein
MSLHLKRSVGSRTEFFPAFDERAKRKQRFLEYTAASIKSWLGGSAEDESFLINIFSNPSSLPLVLRIREHI